jgi:signal transduction histidine kinase
MAREWVIAGALMLVAAVVIIAFARFSRIARRRAVEGERSRIARELHDTVAQGTTGIGLHLETALAMLNEADPATVNIHAAKSLARAMMLDVKRVVLDLPPAGLEGRPLPEAIREMLRMLTDGLPVAACVRVEGTVRDLGAVAAHNMFRVAQEAVTNSLRHSRSRRIELVLTYGPDSVRMSVRDDGRGSGAFSRDEVAAAGGHGYSGMADRAREMRGTLSTRAVAQGVELVLEVPV